MKTQSILLVDDEERNIKLLKAMLLGEDYHISEALSGEEALEKVAGTLPDLILLDVMMPGLDGFEVCSRLKKEEKTKIIPILMVTALQEREHRIRAMEAGADDFLSKPVDRTELLVRAKSLLRMKSYHDDLLESYMKIAEKNERLIQLEKTKDGLIHMIIHDLRNPLMAISGSIELILTEGERLSDKQHQRLDRCFDHCQELGEMIQSLLDTNRMEEGKLVPNKEETNPKELVEKVLEQFRSKILEKKISLSFHQPSDIPSVRIDRRLIKRVIANLLNNAVRHSPKGGRIELAIDFPRDKRGIYFRIKDNGAGLPPEYHQKIFDRFEQVKLKRSGVNVGATGLGLAFCKMALEAHGGKIWVESEGPGKGCTFNSIVPL